MPKNDDLSLKSPLGPELRDHQACQELQTIDRPAADYPIRGRKPLRMKFSVRTAGDPREQGRHPSAVVNVALRDVGSEDLPGPIVNTKVQLAPDPSACSPVFPRMPLASAIDLQTRRIHDDMPSSRTRRQRQAHCQPCLSAAHGAVVGYGEIEPHECHDRPKIPVWPED